MQLLVKDYQNSILKMFQTKSLIKSSNISTGKLTVVEIKLINVSITITNLFLLV